MKENVEILEELEKFIDEYIEEQLLRHREEQTIIDKIQHIKRTALIAEHIYPENKLLKIAMKFHDIGRFLQYEIIENFNDDKLSHKCLGEDIILKKCHKNELKISEELNAIRQVILYHGNINDIPYKEIIPEKHIELVKNATKIDRLENGCIGAIGYLEREIQEDAKEYKKNNPNFDMKEVTPEIWENYKKGEVHNKNCKTYADYILYAALLAIECLKGENREIAKKLMNTKYYEHENAIEGYEYLMNKYIDKNYAKEAIKILKSYL